MNYFEKQQQEEEFYFYRSTNKSKAKHQEDNNYQALDKPWNQLSLANLVIRSLCDEHCTAAEIWEPLLQNNEDNKPVVVEVEVEDEEEGQQQQ
jgi:hypothetical protein